MVLFALIHGVGISFLVKGVFFGYFLGHSSDLTIQLSVQKVELIDLFIDYICQRIDLGDNVAQQASRPVDGGARLKDRGMLRVYFLDGGCEEFLKDVVARTMVESLLELLFALLVQSAVEQQQASENSGLDVVVGQLDGSEGVLPAFALPGSDSVHHGQAAVNIADRQFFLIHLHEDREQVEVADVVHGLKINGPLEVPDGLLVVVELRVEKGTVGVQNGVGRVQLDQLGELLLALHIVAVVEEAGDVFEVVFQQHVGSIYL